MHKCEVWSEPYHTYFQLACFVGALTYFCPNNLKGLIALRLLLGISGVLFCLWTGTIICAIDSFIYNFIFAFVNFGHVAYLCYQMRPVKFKEDEHETLYKAVFEQLAIKRYQYKPLVQWATTERLSKGEFYSVENETRGEKISIMLIGRSWKFTKKELNSKSPSAHFSFY
uniref:POPDC1-3 domain-containing protein n=1 Tax=Clytia hemisphaerica TaxID=252671 RepID=A0A7M5X9Q3_9CNID